MLIDADKDHLAMEVAGLFKLEEILTRCDGPGSEQGIERAVIHQRRIDIA